MATSTSSKGFDALSKRTFKFWKRKLPRQVQIWTAEDGRNEKRRVTLPLEHVEQIWDCKISIMKNRDHLTNKYRKGRCRHPRIGASLGDFTLQQLQDLIHLLVNHPFKKEHLYTQNGKAYYIEVVLPGSNPASEDDSSDKD